MIYTKYYLSILLNLIKVNPFKVIMITIMSILFVFAGSFKDVTDVYIIHDELKINNDQYYVVYESNQNDVIYTLKEKTEQSETKNNRLYVTRYNDVNFVFWILFGFFALFNILALFIEDDNGEKWELETARKKVLVI